MDQAWAFVLGAAIAASVGVAGNLFTYLQFRSQLTSERRKKEIDWLQTVAANMTKTYGEYAGLENSPTPENHERMSCALNELVAWSFLVEEYGDVAESRHKLKQRFLAGEELMDMHSLTAEELRAVGRIIQRVMREK